MDNSLIKRQAAIDGVKTLHDVAWKNWHEPTLSANVVLDMIRELPSAQPEQKAEELLPDGTLHLFTDTDLSKVNRVLVSQNGTHYGDLYYPDEWRWLV